jgi:hypothetical protein
MSEFDKARLAKKYDMAGQSYRELAGKIIQENSTKIARAAYSSDKKRFRAAVNRALPARDSKKLVLPRESELLQRSPTIIKAADRGKLLTKTIREEMRRAVKRGLKEHGISTRAGNIPRRAAQSVRRELEGVYKPYTEKLGRSALPPNIKTIAETESRSVLNGARIEYANRMNKELGKTGHRVLKKWKHNPSLSKVPRRNHAAQGRKKAIPIGEKFALKGFKGAIHRVHGPHDPSLPAEDFINCKCELEFTVVKVS